MKKLYRGTDLFFSLTLKDRLGIQFRVKDCIRLIIKMYTTDPNNYILCQYSDGQLVNIKEGESIDYVIIFASEFDKLDEGIIHATIERVTDGTGIFSDGEYSEKMKVETQYYLTENNCKPI